MSYSDQIKKVAEEKDVWNQHSKEDVILAINNFSLYVADNAVTPVSELRLGDRERVIRGHLEKFRSENFDDYNKIMSIDLFDITPINVADINMFDISEYNEDTLRELRTAIKNTGESRLVMDHRAADRALMLFAGTAKDAMKDYNVIKCSEDRVVIEGKSLYGNKKIKTKINNKMGW